MIFSVVLTPTSEVTNTSSNSSSTSSSTVDFPTTALVIFEKHPSLVFSSPRSSASCASGVSCFFLKKSNSPISHALKEFITKKPFRQASETAFYISYAQKLLRGRFTDGFTGHFNGFFYVVVVCDQFFEGICTGLRRLNGGNHLRIIFALARF